MKKFVKQLWQNIKQMFTNPSKGQFLAFGDFFHKLAICLTVGIFLIGKDWLDVVILAISAILLFIYGVVLIGKGE